MPGATGHAARRVGPGMRSEGCEGCRLGRREPRLLRTAASSTAACSRGSEGHHGRQGGAPAPWELLRVVCDAHRGRDAALHLVGRALRLGDSRVLRLPRVSRTACGRGG